MGNRQTDINRFFVAGINYRKADGVIRSHFAINDEKYKNILLMAQEFRVHECFILSTCNRTEIYGIAEDAEQLLQLLCSQTEGSLDLFREIAYLKKDQAAIQHLFQVAAGLDSQILGDYEVVGQIKHAIKVARENGGLGAFTDRLTNMAFQCSKRIKTTTQLSGGTVSVSFVAVQYIKDHVEDIASKKITLIGTGKFGRNTCKNLVDYLDTRNITLINRTESKAELLAQELGLRSAPLESIAKHVEDSDIILVATNAPDPMIKASHLVNQGKKIIIDLSIPFNVEEQAKLLPGITLINVDELSKMKDETLAKRQAEVPKARAIISEFMAEFAEWHRMRKHVPVLRAVKTKLQEIQHSSLYITLYGHENMLQLADDKIQRVINGMASRIRENNHKGCHYIQAINEFIATGTH